jgi:N-acyl-D-amino-acid deacylase
MPEYELLIKNGTIVEGTRIPAFKGDIGINHGRITAMGNLTGSAARVIDATGLIVAPGFIDVHTHYDAALSGGTKWDPYASLSGWHGVTTVAIGNCGFGFAPVKPEDRDRAMRRMERTESIPLSCMQAGMRWDWITFPEFLNSLERGGLGVNAASLMPYSPLRAYVLGNEAARDPEYTPSGDEIATIKRLLREGLQAGGFGFSGSFSMANRDYDGGYLPTHVVRREEMLEMAKVLGEFNRGSIEWTIGRSLHGLDLKFLHEMAQVSGRPLNWNAVFYNPADPNGWKEQLDWCESAHRLAPIFPVDLCMPGETEFKFADIGLFDDLPSWNEATQGSFEERKARLADPARRPALRRDSEGRMRFAAFEKQDGETGQLTRFNFKETIIEAATEKNKQLTGRTVAEVAEEQGKHPVDVMLDLAVEENLQTEFRMTGRINNDETKLAQILKHPLALIGASDGGAHTKFQTSGSYPTYFLSHWVRDKQLMSLEEAHWRLSSMIGWAIGIRDRGWLREGMPADIVVYDYEKLQLKPMETARDLPDGDWRRVRRADGYRHVIVNGQVTFEDNICTGALPGKMLRSNEQAAG